MKKATLLIILFFVSILANGQIVPSSCLAPDSIKAKYINDADRLALRKIIRRHLNYQDSIIIPKIHSDTVLNALIAIYNATTIPARDSIFLIYQIHSFPNPVLNFLNVAADSTLPWMHQLKLGNIPTGNPTIDSLISNYHLSIYNYSNAGNVQSWHEVLFKSDSNYNLTPLAALFQANPGVYFSQPSGYIGDGNNITDSIYANREEIIYSYGWGDCPSGCISRRYWKFNVYFDCSVEFVDSYGSLINPTAVNNLEAKQTLVFPNPFSNRINVELADNEQATFILYDILSRQILRKTFNKNTIIDANQLGAGIYFYELRNDKKIITNGKLIKN